MWWTALAILVATVGTADARMVRHRDPPVVEACGTRKDWPAVAACLDKLGSFQIERSLGRARLVRVWIDDGKQDAGVYLFIQQKDSTWRIGGMFARGTNDTVIGVGVVTIDRHLGYQLDVGTLQRTPLSLDDAPPMQVTIRTRSSLYCFGDRPYCEEVQTSCEVMTRGKALLAFHGTARIEQGDIVVDGDASRAGSVCTSGQRVSLRWDRESN